MIQKLSHTPIFVDDYDRALDFYVGKLGMEVRSDMAMPGGTFRWLTIAPKGQDIEIVLMKLDNVPISDRAMSRPSAASSGAAP